MQARVTIEIDGKPVTVTSTRLTYQMTNHITGIVSLELEVSAEMEIQNKNPAMQEATG